MSARFQWRRSEHDAPLMKTGTGQIPWASRLRTSCGMYGWSVITCDGNATGESNLRCTLQFDDLPHTLWRYHGDSHYMPRRAARTVTHDVCVWVQPAHVSGTGARRRWALRGHGRGHYGSTSAGMPLAREGCPRGPDARSLRCVQMGLGEHQEAENTQAGSAGMNPNPTCFP